jgi:hypothetical protein
MSPRVARQPIPPTALNSTGLMIRHPALIWGMTV